MNEQNDDTNAVTGVGSRVKVTVPGPDGGRVACTGVVVDPSRYFRRAQIVSASSGLRVRNRS